MTSEIISKLISEQTLSPIIPSNNSIPQNENFTSPKTNLNLKAEKFIPQREKNKNTKSEFHPQDTQNDNSAFISPSFSHYIDPERLQPFDDMLEKNIRSFNLLQNSEKDEETKLENSLKEKYNLDTPTIEINFKFTCDYELIESEIKEFLVLFGDINSFKYDMNGNSLKINYKYYFSAMYANYYLNHLLYENKNENEKEIEIPKKEKNENKNEREKGKKLSKKPEEKQNEDIVKFIKFLTDNYKNEPKIKNNEKEKTSNE